MNRRCVSILILSVWSAAFFAGCGSQSNAPFSYSAQSIALQGQWELKAVGDQTIAIEDSFQMSFASEDQIQAAIEDPCPEAVMLFEVRDNELYRVRAQKENFRCFVNLGPGPQNDLEGLLSEGAAYELKNGSQLQIHEGSSQTFVFERIPPQ